MNALLSALLLGVVTGERTFLGPAALAWSGDASPAKRGMLSVAEAGEMLGDLMPSAPARTSFPVMMARVVSGASVGIAAARRGGEAPAAGAVAGVVGALIGTYGGEILRLKAIDAIGAVPAALAEDGIAIGLAAVAGVLLRSASNGFEG